MSRSDDDSPWQRPAGASADAPTAGSGPPHPGPPHAGPLQSGPPHPGPPRANRPDRPASAIEAAVWGRPPVPAGRPGPPDPGQTGQATTGPAASRPDFFAYAGPPPSNPPPSLWRPSVVNQPQPPRELPGQNHDRIEIEEQAARTLTQGIGMVVAAVLIVLMLILCARSLI